MPSEDARAMDQAPDETRREALRRRDAARARRALLAGSELFDAGWYSARAETAADSDLDPLDHYRLHGVRSVTPPGPMFDPDDYLRRVWHLRRGVDDPLEHFLAFGEAEGREARSLASDHASDAARPSQPFRLLGACPRQPTLAVVVHAFHPELFGEICDALRRLPYRFSLLVTVAEDEHEALVREIVEQHGLDAVLLVRHGANRGRNFGPMLVRFRHAVRAHELVLHLHTKRSLHHPGGLDGWRRDLLRTLLPARAALRGLIAAFDEDPLLGVLSPSPAPELRYWAYNWLRNRAAATELFERLGSRGTLPAGSFDFPAGGMFWARTEAIAALLDHPWREDDFPEERGQTDGTIAHAIERSILLIAADAGYGFRELDAGCGVVRIGWGCRNLFRYPEYGADALQREIDAAGVASFDVFDTLLARICLSPDAVHRFVAIVAEQRFPGATGYVERRRAAEAAARDDGEAGFDEIAARFEADAGPNWSAEAIRFVLDEEIALDLRTLRPRHAVSALLRHARETGRRTILVSDSYLTRPLFDDMLRRFGLDGQVDAIYLSSERRARKDRGDLWTLVKSTEPPGLIHVGDNEQSDSQATADAGLRHAHVLSPAALFRLHGLLPPACEGDLASEILLGSAAEMLFNSPWPEAGPEGPLSLRSPEQAGALLLGPLLFAFVGWLARHPASRRLETLFFVSREGYFLKRLFDAVARRSGAPGLPASRYFHCSRRVALGALQGGGLDVDAVLKGAGYRGSLSDFLLARLGFVADPALGYDRVSIRLPRDDELVRCVMELLRGPIEVHGREMAEGLRAYAQAETMSEGPHGFVDVGYSGTMQSALQRVLGTRLVGLYMGVSHGAAQVRDGGGHAFGAFADGDVAGFTGGYGQMLEAFLTAPHGQTVGYDRTRSPPAPLFRHDGHSQAVFPSLERFYAGAEEYAIALLRCWGPEVLALPFPADAATAMLAAVRSGRLLLDRTLTDALFLEDDFCGNGEIAVFGRPFGSAA